MSLFDIFKRESVTISAKSSLILPGSDQNRKVVCYKCEQEIDERHEVEGCRKPGTSRRVFFGRMAATVAGVAVIAKVAPELITAPAVKLPANLSKESLLAHVKKQQEAVNAVLNQQAQAIVAVPEPIAIPADIPAGFRKGRFFAQIYGFQIEYDAKDRMDQDRVLIKVGRDVALRVDPKSPSAINSMYWGEQVSPPKRNWRGGDSFEGSLHETITAVNRDYPHLALDLRAAIMSCNPEWRWRQAHNGGDMPKLEHEYSLGPLPRKILNPERLPV